MMRFKRKWYVLASCVCLSANFLMTYMQSAYSECPMTQTSLPPGTHITTCIDIGPTREVRTSGPPSQLCPCLSEL